MDSIIQGMKYSNRSVWQSFVSSPFSVVALIVVVFVLARASLNINNKVELSAVKLQQAQANLDKLMEHQRDVSRKVEYLSTEQGIEAEIRTKYHAVKDGEQVAVIVDDSKKLNNSQTASTTTATSSSGFFRRILRVFGF